MNRFAILGGLASLGAARWGIFGTNTLDLRETDQVKYIDVDESDFGFVTTVDWWNDWKDNRVCDHVRKFYIRPVKVLKDPEHWSTPPSGIYRGGKFF